MKFLIKGFIKFTSVLLKQTKKKKFTSVNNKIFYLSFYTLIRYKTYKIWTCIHFFLRIWTDMKKYRSLNINFFFTNIIIIRKLSNLFSSFQRLLIVKWYNFGPQIFIHSFQFIESTKCKILFHKFIYNYKITHQFYQNNS